MIKHIVVPARKRGKTPGELEKEDLLLRLEALEQEAKRKNPEFRVPEPPTGLERTKTLQP